MLNWSNPLRMVEGIFRQHSLVQNILGCLIVCWIKELGMLTAVKKKYPILKWLQTLRYLLCENFCISDRSCGSCRMGTDGLICLLLCHKCYLQRWVTCQEFRKCEVPMLPFYRWKSLRVIFHHDQPKYHRNLGRFFWAEKNGLFIF